MQPEQQARRADTFRALHSPGHPLIMPNPWDAGSARLLASLGFAALATTSGGFAATLGRRDGNVTRDEALEHAARLAAAVDVPVSADLENGFGRSPAEVALTAAGAREAGLAGFSVEDATGNRERPIHDIGHAVERVAAAAEQAHATGLPRLVLTARAENHLHGRDDLADTIARLRAFEAAGADVVFAPGLTAARDIAAVVDAVGVPVSVLLLAGGPSVAELAALGVSRVSTGSALAWAGYGAVVAAAQELRDAGTTSWLAGAATGAKAARGALTDQPG
ncbi:MAG TPA: isocitrate lyase/phosphoenolpyruvate mutase family protein [Solirubrobacteraceae bacterium]|nr:isocitrate lyase/phosphoenolpyruvate mutase family protein [Solirubrobacteraceae bacterium]